METANCRPLVGEVLEPRPLLALPVSSGTLSRRLTLLSLVLLCLGRPGLSAQDVGESPVWVNQSSGVYHCKGTRYYGKTRVGEFLPEATARARGHRPAGGKSCSAQLDMRALVEADYAFPPPDRDEPRDPPTALRPCTIELVVDGDTIRCAELGAVRLIGIDAPEMEHGNAGAIARAALERLIASGTTVQLEVDVQGRDRYRRVLAYVWRDRRQVNYQMVRAGWASIATYPPNVRYVEAFTRAQRRARAAGIGFWRDG